MARGAEELERWVESIVSACSGLETEAEISKAIDEAGEAIDPEAFAAIVEEALVRGSMLGAVDSLVEREQDEDDPLPQMASWREPVLQRIAGAKQVTNAPFADAIQLFADRKVMPRELFDELTDAAKQKAFTVAGLAAEELLAEAHAELARQLKDSEAKTFFDETTQRWVHKGPNLREFDKFARERLKKAGWVPANPSHVETVFRTNIASAYSSGGIVERTQPAVLAVRPYWQIVGVGDSRQRKTHRDAHGTILAADHPFWRKAYPPFGYNCRCRVVSRSKRWVDAHGGPTRVPSGLPDKGFASGIEYLAPKAIGLLGVARDGERDAVPPSPAHQIDRTPRAPFPQLVLPERPSPLPVAAHPPEFLRLPRAPEPVVEPNSFRAFMDAGFRIESEDKFRVAQLRAKEFFGAPLTPKSVRSLIGAEGELQGATVAYRVSGDARNLYVAATVEDDIGAAAQIIRSYTVAHGEKIVHHDLLRLPERLQNSKFGSRMFANQIRQYLAAGVHLVETEAAWVGQYYWPSIGYQLRSPSFLQVLKYEFIKYATASGIAEADALKIAGQCPSLHELAMAKYNRRKIGKEFLVNRGNSGGSLIELELDLSEGSRSRAILKQRLGI